LPLVRDVGGEWRPFDLSIDAPKGSQQRAARPEHRR